MSGIYLHIPFCKKACHYCNFHFSTSLKQKDALIEALLKEINLQKNYLGNQRVETIYFGGGTPSLLSIKDLQKIFEQLYQTFTISKTAEITLEANPDDLTLEKLKALQTTPINRLSIGIQSFNDTDLLFMNRTHNAQEAISCIQNAQAIGFENLTIDLIYGSPTTSLAQWEANLHQTFSFQIPHFSAYCLTVEPKTVLAHMVKTGKAKNVEEEKAAQHFDVLRTQAETAGYQQYETSNFAIKNWESKHNSSYWQGKNYLGLGPAAHSFNGATRQWNIANNAHYIKALQQHQLPFELEKLSKTDRFNEYLMTTLRTIWGCDLQKIQANFGKAYLKHLQKAKQIYVEKGIMIEKENKLFLTPQGRFLADGIISQLFYEEK